MIFIAKIYKFISKIIYGLTKEPKEKINRKKTEKIPLHLDSETY